MDSSWDRDVFYDLGMMEVYDDYFDVGVLFLVDCWGGISGLFGFMDGKFGNGFFYILDFFELIVWKYVKSFNDNIQNMYLFIIFNELNVMVKLFFDGFYLSLRSKGGGLNIVKFVVGL